MILKIKNLLSLVTVSTLMLFSFTILVEAASDGVIDSDSKTALLCTNDACTTTSRINFKPSSVLAGQEVHITNTELKGFVWSEDMGWIVLNCSNTPSGCSSTNGNFKVANDGKGNLSGYAWGQNAGWINFGPFVNNTATEVSINSDGEFNGYAWAQNYGWIKFDCSSANACVKTDWRVSSGNSGGVIGGGGITINNVDVDVCLNISGNQSVVPPGFISQGGQCKTFCELNPNDSFCVAPIKEDKCSNISGNQSIVPSGLISQGGQCKTFCEFNPTDTSCTKVVPTFCELNPGDPTCQSKTFCENYPSDPICQTEDFCESHPSDPSCLGGGITEEDKNDSDKEGWNFPITQVFMENFIKIAEINLKKFAMDTIERMKTPAGKTLLDILTATGIISGASLSIATLLFANPLTFGELFLIPLRLWSLILAALGIKKRNRPWGTVYDSVTKQPLDPAYVVLQDLNGNEVATSITDLDGRYGFLVPAGQYRLFANKTNYEFPSKKLMGKSSDELYPDLYFDGIITIEEGEVIIKNIPMDPLKFDWNEFAKKDQKLMKFFSKRDVWVARLSNFLFAFGFIITSITVVAMPKVYNIIVFCIYVLLYILKHTVLKRSPSGKITENGDPLSFAIIRVFSVATGHEIIHKVADKIGKYYCLIPNGNYYVKIEKKNEDGSYTLAYTSNEITVSKGYIGNNFKF